MSMSVSTSGITSNGFDVKLATGGDLAIESAVTLGVGDLTLNTTGNVSQTSAGAITASGLQILGSGTVRLDSASNNVTTLAANHTGSLSYADTDSLTVGSVTDTAMSASVSTSGIASFNDTATTATYALPLHDALPIFGVGDLTLNTTGNVSQTSAAAITATGLQILGSGTVRLDAA